MSTIGSRIRSVFAWRWRLGTRPPGGERAGPGWHDGASSWRPRYLSIRLALAATFGVIIAMTAAALVLSLESGRENTIELVRDRSEHIIDTIVQRIRFHLDPARDQSKFL